MIYKVNMWLMVSVFTGGALCAASSDQDIRCAKKASEKLQKELSIVIRAGNTSEVRALLARGAHADAEAIGRFLRRCSGQYGQKVPILLRCLFNMGPT